MRLRFLESNDEVHTHHSVKCDSVFNKLSNFHVCQPGLPACLAHDLFEGVVDYDLALFLQFLIRTQKWFSYEVLNERFKKFPGESSVKLNTIPTTGARLGGHAAQNRWLLRFSPVLVHNTIEDANNEVWGLVLLLRELVEFVCAPRLSEIVFMKGLIELYVELRQELFPRVKLRPKHHFHHSYILG